MVRSAGHECIVLNTGSYTGNVAAANRLWDSGRKHSYWSIHSNAGGGHGTETFYYPGSAPGLRMAQLLQSHIGAVSNYPDRGIKTTTALYEIRGTKAPAALTEMLFHDNVIEAQEMRTDWPQFGKAVGESIIEFLGGAVVKPPTPTPTPVPKPNYGKIVNCSYVNVRSQPSMSGIVGSLKVGTVVTIGGVTNGWRRVYTPKNGWVYGKYVQDI